MIICIYLLEKYTTAERLVTKPNRAPTVGDVFLRLVTKFIHHYMCLELVQQRMFSVHISCSIQFAFLTH